VTPDGYMEKALRALSSARLLLGVNDVEGACNRAYYAMFASAHAALLWSGTQINPAETKTHSGLIGAFGRKFVKTGRVLPDRSHDTKNSIRKAHTAVESFAPTRAG